jgi:hypothetical protein
VTQLLVPSSLIVVGTEDDRDKPGNTVEAAVLTQRRQILESDREWPRMRLYAPLVVLQIVLRRPPGRVLYRAASRAAALAWEQTHFGAGNSGWRT